MRGAAARVVVANANSREKAEVTVLLSLVIFVPLHRVQLLVVS
jgi:hypothetical protein